MTITSFNDLREWFRFGFDKGVRATEEGRETTSPYWTLYAVGLGGKDTVLAFNDRLTGLDESYTALVESIRRMNNPTGSMFRVFQTYRPRFNNATQETRVQIFENNLVPAAPQSPGIGSLVGYVEESKIAEILRTHREKWEMERRMDELEAQLAAPKDWTDTLINGLERIGQTPVGAMLMAKYLGAPLPPVPSPAVTGTHTPDDADNPDSDDLDPELDTLEELAKANGLTLKQFLAKTAALAQSQPGVVAMLAQS